ncbi:ovochymase-like [Prorops nasuta]|uniref:ovochymase-like n=1 Tax=Prorops nasuta TaxID=863751 RepID=UPI0034CF4401
MKVIVTLLICLALLSIPANAQLSRPTPDCTTPDQFPGRCISIRQCEPLLNIIRSQPLRPGAIDFLRQSQCGFQGKNPLVCCTIYGAHDMGGGLSTPPPTQDYISTGSPQDPNNRSPDRSGTSTYDYSNNPLLPTDCGQDLSKRILGGEIAEIDEFPWMALLEYQKPNGRITACGGVLINSRYVLTAAHCVKGKDLPKNWRLTAVRLGEYNTDTTRDCIQEAQGTQFCADDPVTVGVEEQIAHEEYKPLSRDQKYDIALLRLTQSVRFTTYIQPICLPANATVPDTKLFVAGWGKTEISSVSNVKLKLSIPIADGQSCRNTYSSAGVNLGFGQICAGGELGKDSCRGDSGGPLMGIEGNNKWAAIGVVSFGPSPCGMEGWPGVYTKVSDFVPWILTKIRTVEDWRDCKWRTNGTSRRVTAGIKSWPIIDEAGSRLCVSKDIGELFLSSQERRGIGISSHSVSKQIENWFVSSTGHTGHTDSSPVPRSLPSARSRSYQGKIKSIHSLAERHVNTLESVILRYFSLLHILFFTRKMFLLLIVSHLFIQAAVAQDRCLSPSSQIGNCVNIRNCQALIDILRKPRPLPQEDLDFLRNSHCGFEGNDPKVCCEERTTTTTESTMTQSDTGSNPDPPDVTNHPNLALLDHNICGPLTQPKIFGGNKTGVFDYPWMALIAYNVGKPEKEFRCGGTILNKRYILTAAHCVTGLPEGMALAGVRIGDHDLGTERDCDRDADDVEVTCAERYQDFEVDTVHFHPGYTRTRLHNDIALIRLRTEADFRPKNARPICMPIGPGATISQKKVTVTGWGATELGPRSQALLYVLLKPVPNEECAESYKRVSQIWYKQMCAGGKSGKDSCLGDSGGPLQAAGSYNKSVRYIQYGIVSFGLRSCGTEGFPGVYTRVPYYLDWILDTIRP